MLAFGAGRRRDRTVGSRREGIQCGAAEVFDRDLDRRRLCLHSVGSRNDVVRLGLRLRRRSRNGTIGERQTSRQLRRNGDRREVGICKEIQRGYLHSRLQSHRGNTVGEERSTTELAVLHIQLRERSSNALHATVSEVVLRTLHHGVLSVSDSRILLRGVTVHNHRVDRDHLSRRTRSVRSRHRELGICHHHVQRSGNNTRRCVKGQAFGQRGSQRVTRNQSVDAGSERLSLLVHHRQYIATTVTHRGRRIQLALVILYGVEMQRGQTLSVDGSTVSVRTRLERLASDKGARVAVLGIANADRREGSHVQLSNLNTLARGRTHLSVVLVVRLLHVQLKVLVTTITAARPRQTRERSDRVPVSTIIRSLEGNPNRITRVTVTGVETSLVHILTTVVVVRPLNPQRNLSVHDIRVQRSHLGVRVLIVCIRSNLAPAIIVTLTVGREHSIHPKIVNRFRKRNINVQLRLRERSRRVHFNTESVTLVLHIQRSELVSDTNRRRLLQILQGASIHTQGSLSHIVSRGLRSVDIDHISSARRDGRLELGILRSRIHIQLGTVVSRVTRRSRNRTHHSSGPGGGNRCVPVRRSSRSRHVVMPDRSRIEEHSRIERNRLRGL